MDAIFLAAEVTGLPGLVPDVSVTAVAGLLVYALVSVVRMARDERDAERQERREERELRRKEAAANQAFADAQRESVATLRDLLGRFSGHEVDS